MISNARTLPMRRICNAERYLYGYRQYHHCILGNVPAGDCKRSDSAGDIRQLSDNAGLQGETSPT